MNYMQTTKFLLIYHLLDGKNNEIAYCSSENEVRQIIVDWAEDGKDLEEMEVVRVRKISKVKTKIIRSKIIF